MTIHIDFNPSNPDELLLAYDSLWHLQRTIAKHVPDERHHRGNPAHGTNIQTTRDGERLPSRVAANYDAE